MKSNERGSIRSNLNVDSECGEPGDRNRCCMDIKEFLSRKPSADEILEYVEAEARRIAGEKKAKQTEETRNDNTRGLI